MRKPILAAAAGAVLAFAFVGPGFAGTKDADGNHGPTGYSNQYDDEGANTIDCGDSGAQTLDYVGATNLWPPNHKAVLGSVIANDDNDDSVDGQPTVFVTGSSNDAYEDGDVETAYDSAANAATDGEGHEGTATADLKVLRERSGQAKEGRRYDITATATFDDGSTCQAHFSICVPHDMRSSTREADCPNPSGGTVTPGA